MDNIHGHAHAHARAHSQVWEARRTDENVNVKDILRRAHIPDAPSRPSQLMERSRALLVPRDTCTSDSDDGCHKPTTTPTVPIVLAAV